MKTIKKPLLSVRKLPKQQRSKKMVEAILQASAHILEQGVEPFTTNHIAKKAGVSIGSLYQYFPNADAIMAALIEFHVEEEISSAQHILSTRPQSARQTLQQLILAFVEAHAKAPRLTAQLHTLAPLFGLQDYLAHSRNLQATQIAEALNLPESEVQIAVIAIEGVVLAMLTQNPKCLRDDEFINRLFAIAQALLRPKD